MRLLVMGVLVLLVLGATTAGAASAKQVGLFEPQTGTQVSSSQKLGTFADFDLEGGRAECQSAWVGDLERWLPEFEPPPLKTTLYYRGGVHWAEAAECSSEVAGETIEMKAGGLSKIELTSPTKATVNDGYMGVYEYHHQPGGLYCSYDGPYKSHLASRSGADRAEWVGTVVLKRVRLESDRECPESVSSEVTVGVSGEEIWDGEALETKRVG
ncbi:MAG: hypothetical protein ACLPUT_06810 [Solirubrobacteraceae bacterium]